MKYGSILLMYRKMTVVRDVLLSKHVVGKARILVS